MKTIVIIFFLFSCVQAAFSQVDTTESTESVIEDILDNSADEEDLSLTVDELEYYHDNPINLRTAVYSELIKLPFISSSLAIKIILLRDSVELSSLEVLKRIPEMNDELLHKFSLFTTTEDLSPPVFYNFIPNSLELRSRYERRLQLQQGYRNGIYAGSRDASYQRLKTGSNYFQLAGLFEKDAGEKMNNGFLAGYAMFRNYGIVKKIVVGNYTITFGEGLALSKNLQTTKGTNAVGQIKKRGDVIYPSVSADEFRYFQGAAGMFDFGALQLSTYYSERNLPASRDTNDVVTSFYTSGLFRTQNDLKRKNAVRENTVGGIVTYNLLEGSQAGVTVNRVQYNHWLIPTLYNFGNTKEKIISSAWTVLNFSTISIFSEFASNDAERFSTISGITYQPVREFAVALSRRSYSQGYTSPFSRPFGVRSDISDGERGAYLGIELRPVRGLYFSAYYDSYELPDRLAFGSTGREMFVHSLLSSFRSWTLYFHLRNKIRNQLSIYEFDDVRNQNNYRFQFAYKISPAFTLTQRLEIVTVDYSPSRYHEKGYLIFSEAAYRKTNSPFTGKFRFVIYDTESYDSRIYQYESDVQGNFSNPPLYGKGMRWYFLAGYKMFEVFQFSIKYSETLRFNVLSMGSGNDVINGNLDNQLAVQLDVRL